MLRQASKHFVTQQLPVSVMWTEGGAQPKLEAVTDMTFGYPALVAVHLQKKVFALLQGSFTLSAIKDFATAILAGSIVRKGGTESDLTMHKDIIWYACIHRPAADYTLPRNNQGGGCAAMGWAGGCSDRRGRASGYG